MFKKVLSLFILTAVIMINLTACNSKSESKEKVDSESKQTFVDITKSDSGKSKIIESTDLMSKGEAEKLLGISLKGPQISEKKTVGMKLVIYNAIDENSGKYIQITISQESFMSKKTLESGQSPKSIYKSIKDNFPDGTVVEGIGDDAFIAPPGMHILKGEYYITIAVAGSGKKDNPKVLEEAGTIVIKNLK